MKTNKPYGQLPEATLVGPTESGEVPLPVIERQLEIVSTALEKEKSENNRLALENCGLAKTVTDLRKRVGELETERDSYEYQLKAERDGWAGDLIKARASNQTFKQELSTRRQSHGELVEALQWCLDRAINETTWIERDFQQWDKCKIALTTANALKKG